MSPWGWTVGSQPDPLRQPGDVAEHAEENASGAEAVEAVLAKTTAVGGEVVCQSGAALAVATAVAAFEAAGVAAAAAEMVVVDATAARSGVLAPPVGSEDPSRP